MNEMLFELSNIRVRARALALALAFLSAGVDSLVLLYRPPLSPIHGGPVSLGSSRVDSPWPQARLSTLYTRSPASESSSHVPAFTPFQRTDWSSVALTTRRSRLEPNEVLAETRASLFAPTPSMGHPISGELWDCRLWSTSEIYTISAASASAWEVKTKTKQTGRPVDPWRPAKANH